MKTIDVFGLFGRSPHLGVLPPTAKAAFESASNAARKFQNAIDRAGRATNQELKAYEEKFNESFDEMVRQGGSPNDAYATLQQQGIRPTILRDVRPDPLVNHSTGAPLYSPAGTKPQPTSPPSGSGQKPVTQPAKPVASTHKPAPPPGGPHGYEEEYQQYQYQKDQYANRPPETTSGQGQMTSREVQSEAIRRHIEWMRKAGIDVDKYAPDRYQPAVVTFEPSAPPPPPPPPPSKPGAFVPPPPSDVASIDQKAMECKQQLGPNAFFDGRQCKSGNMTANAGGLMNQAMNLGPSGGMGPGMVTAQNLDFNPATIANTNFMGKRIRVQNLGQSIKQQQWAEKLQEMENYLSNYCQEDPADNCEQVEREYSRLLALYNQIQQIQDIDKPPAPAPTQSYGQHFQDNNASMYSWSQGTADCAPPMVPAPGGGCMPGPVATQGGGRKFGNLMNQAMNFGPSGASMPTMVSPGNLDINPATIANTNFMGSRRFQVKNLG